MLKKWNYSPLNNESTARKLAQELNISPVLAALLVARGVTTFEEARRFFRPSMSDLGDPYLMPDMAQAVERLTRALQHKEKILVYGDYDVDGTTAVSLVYLYLLRYCASSEIDYYIPDRYTEGYGVSTQGIDYAAEHGISLIIALDCGIKDVERVEYAASMGIDFIICDHHTPDEVIPRAVAVIDAKRTDIELDPKLYRELSGCGVGFKFMQAFHARNPLPGGEEYLHHLLSLLAISIASDIVPITGENRILAYYGLIQLNKNPLPGLMHIMHSCNLKPEVTEQPGGVRCNVTVSDIVFKIGPRINAAGRMRRAQDVVDLLISKDEHFIRVRTADVNAYNEERKSLDKNITDEAIHIVESDPENARRKSIVVYSADWGQPTLADETAEGKPFKRDKGVVGIVASRLTERFFRPTVVLTLWEGMATGSARSVPGFDLYAAIDSCRDLLDTFGGHTYAAGLSMKVEHVEAFRERFEDYVSRHITPEQQVPRIEIDARIPLSEINDKFFRILRQFNPFGPGNQNPVFATENLYTSTTMGSHPVGIGGRHLKLSVSDPTIASRIDGIAFGMGDRMPDIEGEKPFALCYTLEENTFRAANYPTKNPKVFLQLMVRDLKTEADRRAEEAAEHEQHAH